MNSVYISEVDFLKISQDVSAKHFDQMFRYKKSIGTFDYWDIYPDISQFSQYTTKYPKNVLDEGKSFPAHLGDWDVWDLVTFCQNMFKK